MRTPIGKLLVYACKKCKKCKKAKAQRRERAFAFSSLQLAKRKAVAREKSGASKSTPAKIWKSPKGRRT